jgi:hypothetical protein
MQVIETGKNSPCTPTDSLFIVSEKAKGVCLAIQMANGAPLQHEKDGILKRFSESELEIIAAELQTKKIAFCTFNDGILTGRLIVPFQSIDVDRTQQAVTQRLLQPIASRKTKENLLFFLTPNERIDPEKYDFMDLRKEISCDPDWVSMKLQALPYELFLATPYWQILSHRVKLENGFSCSVCNSNKNLHCHHRKYPARGTEILNHHSILTCLCETCHSMYHGAKHA